MKSKSLRVAIAGLVAVGLAASTMTASAHAATKTFNVWWYTKDNAMAQTWAVALKELQKKHPEVKVNFQLKTFETMNNTGAQLLNSNSAPDLTEYNKGNGTAGLAAKAGLLTDLTSYAAKNKWNLPSSVALYGQYNKAGLMGTGNLYGVPTYGEYVSVFYNKDLFAKNGVAVPTTMDAMEAAMAKFKAAGVVPMEMAGGDYQTVHNVYALAVSKADQKWISSFQLFQGKKIDATTDANIKWAASTLIKWSKAGYFEPNASGVKADDAVAEFQAGKAAMMIGGSWLDTGMETKATFKYGKFLVPGTLTVGSAGNLFVIPAKSKNKDLAAEFITMLLSKKYQNYLGNAGGLALFADPESVANPAALLTGTPFGVAVKKNALAMYPDWPVPGYYPILLAEGTKLLSDGNVDNYMKVTGEFYNNGIPK